MKNRFLLLKPLSLWYLVMAAHALRYECPLQSLITNMFPHIDGGEGAWRTQW